MSVEILEVVIFALIAVSRTCGEGPSRRFAALGDGDIFGEPMGVRRGELFGEGRGNSSSVSRSAAFSAAGDSEVGEGVLCRAKPPPHVNGLNDGAEGRGELAGSDTSLMDTLTFASCSLSTSSTRTSVPEKLPPAEP